MRVLGIDPGMNGAACVLWPSAYEGCAPNIEIIDLPTLGEGSKREIDGGALMRWLLLNRPDNAIIENVTAMPSIPDAAGVRRGMGSASAFRFGMGVGAVRAVVQCCMIPYRLVVPASWKKLYGLKGSDKELSRQLAIQRFPNAAELLKRKLDHQRAEALLIAHYGAKTF